MKSIFIIALLILISGIIFQVKDDALQHDTNTVESILNGHVKAMGGYNLWGKLSTYVVHQRRPNGLEVTLTVQKPDQCKFEFRKDTIRVVKSYNGNQGCVIKNGKHQEMRPGEEIEMAEEPMFYEELMLAQHMGYEITYIGKEKVDQQSCYLIELIKPNNDVQKYWIDTATYLIKMTGEYSEDSAHHGIYYKTTFDDYRNIGGYLFPFKSALITDDREVDLSCYKIEVNIPLSKNHFDCHKN